MKQEWLILCTSLEEATKTKSNNKRLIPAPRFNEDVLNNDLRNFVSKCSNICYSLIFQVSNSHKEREAPF
jgi:hypothetical protein